MISHGKKKNLKKKNKTLIFRGFFAVVVASKLKEETPSKKGVREKKKRERKLKKRTNCAILLKCVLHDNRTKINLNSCGKLSKWAEEVFNKKVGYFP